MHDRVDELLFTALRIHHLHDHDLDALVAQFPYHVLDVGDGLGLVLLDGDGAGDIAHDLPEDGGAHDHLLALLQKGAEVGSQVRFALAAVDDDALALGARRRRELDMRREGRTTQAHDAAETDLVQDGLVVGRDLGNERVGRVDAFEPLVAFHGDFDAGLGVARQVLAGADGLDRPGDGRVDERGHEAAGFGDHLAHLHLVPHGDDGLRRRADVLGHGQVHGRSQRQLLDRALAGNLVVVRMDSADGKCVFRHWRPPLLSVDGS